MASKVQEENVVDSYKSPAAKYKQLLLEAGCGPGPHEDKMILVFKVLDQIMPHLGVFVEVMKMCRDEMFEAIYSDQYTGSDEDKKKKRYIQRLPYFTLIKRIHTERDEINEKLNQQLEMVKEKLFDKQMQYEEACDKIKDLEKHSLNMKEMIEDLEAELANRNEDYDSLQMTLDEVKEAAERSEYQLQCDIVELKEDLQDARTEAAFLQQYKSGYDDLQEAFENSVDFDMTPPKRKAPPSIATKRSHIIASIENANKLETQILTVQNATIEEFDRFMEQHKETLQHEDGADDDDDGQRDAQMDIDQADQQLVLQQARFEKTIDDMNLELDLLRQQRAGMMEQLQALEESKPKIKEKKKKPKTERSQTESSLKIDLEEIDETTQVDPFALQERIFSRYAAMLYASDNNGKTFHEFKDAEYCKSCGEKTVMCPHKILRQEHVFNLPSNATHIKVTRPKVRINTSLVQETLKEERGSEARPTVPSSKSLRSRVSISAQMSPFTSKTPGSEMDDRYSGYGEGDLDAAHFIHSVDRLWDDFKSRTELDRMVPRPLSMNKTLKLILTFMSGIMYEDDSDPDLDDITNILDRVLSLMGQFSCHLCFLDNFVLEGEFQELTFGHETETLLEEYVAKLYLRDKDVLNTDHADSLDSLYQFMSERYLKEDIMYFATHDFISAIIKFAPTNKTIWLFAQTLIGNLDAAVFRYILLLGDFISQVEWTDVEDFKAFAEVIYPFLGEDDLDAFQMNYTSYSENTVSKTLVAEFIVYNIMKYREPRFIEYENKLLNAHHSDNTFMTELEFIDASDEALGVVNDKLRRRLYNEAYNYVRTKDGMAEGVPIARLAQITSYLSVVEVMAVMKSSVGRRVEQARIARQHDTNTGKPAHMRVKNEVSPQYELLTWSSAQKLAEVIAKQRIARRNRDKTGEE